MRSIKKGATSQSVYFEFLDSTSTTGGRKTGLVFNTSGLTAYYTRNQAATVAITLATLALPNTAWSSGGFVEVSSANAPGLYRLDVPDAAFATGAESVAITMKGATGMAQASLEIALVDNNALDIFSRLGAPAGASVSADILALPTANSNADALLDRTNGVETSWTFRQAMRIILSALGGKASGLATTTAAFRDMADSKNRISATVDASGNRTAVTLDAS